MNQSARVTAFRRLHEAGCFVMPNPWDVGSARWLRSQSFEALATTSLGYAFAQGRADQDVPCGMMLAHIAEMVSACPDVPFNADFENAYADSPDGVAANVTACVATGVAGLSVEDATGRAADPLYDFDLALARIKAARAAIDAGGSGVLLTARAEGVLVHGVDALPDVLRRITAFAEAGADVLYAPGIRTSEQISAVVAAAGGKPVNVLIFGNLGLSVADVASLGGRRISVGGAMARAAWAGLMKATALIRDEGSFTGFADNGRTAPLGAFFKDDLKARS
ncbi:MAG: isocitrate lyase/PEP mutase family protein [Bosea sp. (in: a-proteobacteria)]